MSRIFGFVIGILWLVLAFLAFQRAAAGWAANAGDLAFWWGVITAFLLVAAGTAIVGTLLHTRHPRGRAS